MNLILNPLWLVALPLVMAPVTYFVRRREGLAALLASGTMLVATRLCLSTPFDWSFSILGRPMLLRPGDRMFLAFAFFLVMCYFIYAWLLPQGWSFFPFVLLIMALFCAFAMIDNTIIAVLVLEIAATFAVLIIQAGRRGSIKAGLHYLVAMVLAVPPLLLAAHLSEMHILNPDDPGLPKMTAFLFVLGFGLFLGMVPFQSWLFAVSTEAPTMVSAFLFSIGSGIVMFKLFGLFHRFPWLVTSGEVLRLTLAAGVGSVMVGGLLATFQRDFGRLLGWAVLADTGFLLLSLSPNSPEGVSISALLVLSRAISAALVGMGMGILRRDRESDAFAAMVGAARHKPFAVLALAVGGLSLAGFPLTAGFTARWLAYQSLSIGAQRWTFAVLLATLGVSLGYLRGLASTLGHSEAVPAEDEPLAVRLLVILLVGFSLFLALYPQLALDPISKVMAGVVITR